MIRQRTYSVLFALGLAFCLFNTVGCAKKCQPPETEKIKSVTAFPWRLVESTDPDLKGLNKYTFLIFEFTQNMTGDIKKVLNNTQYDTPVKTFIYIIDRSGGRIRSKYTAAAPEEGQATDTTGLQSGGAGTNDIVDYTYDLGREFEMTDQKRGYYYRFVPFKGIVEPDADCEF